jgi:hypothetical protein
VQGSGGSPTGVDCTGELAVDFNALIQGGTEPALGAERELYVQSWSRDPASASTTSLSNGLRGVIGP